MSYYKNFYNKINIIIDVNKIPENRKERESNLDYYNGGLKTKDFIEELKIIKEELKKCFIFKMSKSLAILLWNTDADENSLEELKLPYDYTFIDACIEFDWYKIEGMYLYFEKSEGGKNSLILRFLITYKDEKDIYFGGEIITFNLTSSELEIDSNGRLTLDEKSELKKYFKNFVLNFLNFLNNPDIEFVQKHYSQNQMNTIENKSRGMAEINVYGKLRKYVDNITNQIKDVRFLKRAHWVRGHWMRFNSERYVNKKGQKTWVYPFIRGYGEALKKDYVIKKEIEGSDMA